jgi:hypothetical protein
MAPCLRLTPGLIPSEAIGNAAAEVVQESGFLKRSFCVAAASVESPAAKTFMVPGNGVVCTIGPTTIRIFFQVYKHLYVWINVFVIVPFVCPGP